MLERNYQSECYHCGHSKAAHSGVLGECPIEHRFHTYRPKYNMDGTFDTEWQSEPVCPRCGARVQDWTEYGDSIVLDGEYRIDCPECEEPFDSVCCVTYEFSTTAVTPEILAREKFQHDVRQVSHHWAAMFDKRLRGNRGKGMPAWYANARPNGDAIQFYVRYDIHGDDNRLEFTWGAEVLDDLEQLYTDLQASAHELQPVQRVRSINIPGD